MRETEQMRGLTLKRRWFIHHCRKYKVKVRNLLNLLVNNLQNTITPFLALNKTGLCRLINYCGTVKRTRY